MRTHGKLANLNIINTQDLVLLADPEFEGWQVVPNELKAGKDQTGSDERICAASEGVGDLIPKLYPVMVQPAALDDSDSVQMSDVISGQGSQ